MRKTAPKEVPFKAFIYATRPKKFYKCGTVSTSDELLWLTNGKVEMGDGFKYWADGDEYQCLNGRIIGEFICDNVFLLRPYTYDGGSADLEQRKLIQTFEGSSKDNEILAATCLSQDEIFDYIGVDNYGYGWHIADLKIYDKPRELSDFYVHKYDRRDYCDGCVHHECPVTKYPCCECDEDEINRAYLYRPPQSWCYVEELE